MQLPFAIDRELNMSLAEQMFQGLRKAIVKGCYKPGQTLPGIHELAKAAGVSEKVSRQALKRLSDIGWCSSRQGYKSVVSDRGKLRLGRVLFFSSGTGLDYHSSWLVSSLRALLLKANYRLVTVSAFDLGADGSSGLLVEALREHWDLLIEFGFGRLMRDAIEKSGWPFVILGNGGRCVPSGAATCVGKIELRNGKAVPDFVRACVRRRVHSVVQFLYGEGGFDATELLSVSEIACTTVRVPLCRQQIGMYTGAYAAMSNFLDDEGGMPDVFLFTDDHLAQGGLMALMERGIRIPEDVLIVTHSNRGFGPFWTKPLTRMEMDPVEQGRVVARAVLKYFKTGILPLGIDLGSVWKPGKTF